MPSLEELTRRYGRMRCPCDKAQLDKGGTIPFIALSYNETASNPDRLKCTFCGQIFRFIGILIRDNWQGEGEMPKHLTESELPLSVINIKPANTRK